MKSLLRLVVFTGLLLPGVYAMAKSASPETGRNLPPDANAQAQPASSDAAEGEKRFHEHCGRCHNPPEDLSPREAKAVIRKMRVRAMLSAEDERLILQYIAP